MKFRTNIDKLKILTETLIDRDFMRTKVLSLFDSFCNDFPIPMNAWIVNSNLKIIARKGCLLSDSEGECDVRKIFHGNAREKNIAMHEQALKGEIVTYVLSNKDKTFLTKLMPASGDSQVVFGVSMDITSFVDMKNVIEAHCLDTDSEKCKLVKKINDDDLYKILKSAGV